LKLATSRLLAQVKQVACDEIKEGFSGEMPQTMEGEIDNDEGQQMA
jgi:hypothetical protein